MVPEYLPKMPKITPKEISEACEALKECMTAELELQSEIVQKNEKLRLAHSRTVAAKELVRSLSYF
jgi:hypothetical protein